MSKRKLEADEFEEEWTETKRSTEVTIIAPKKNSLDSDEEEDDADDKNYQILDCDDIEGQEEATAQFDGDVRITPFNMKEEMEEGHFDTDGHYHFNKEARDEIKDSWLDNIDWMKVKKATDEEEKKMDADTSSSSDDEGPVFDALSSYKKILEFLLPGETVAKALRRLGGGASLSASQRLKLKKQGLASTAAMQGDKTSMLALTDLANVLLNKTGNMNVYQETYEQISRMIKVKSKPAPKVEKADELDMYADDFDEKEKERLAGSLAAEAEGSEEGTSSKDEPSTSGTSAGDIAGEDEVSWEFKWCESSEEIHGPHSSAQMQTWVKESYFKDTTCVRKVGSGSNFYALRRVDFELYI